MSKDNDNSASATKLGTVTGLDSKNDTLIEVNDHVWVSKDISDSIMVTTAEGNVIINTGMPGNGDNHRQRFQKVSQQPVRYVIVTQCHGDHFGGVYELSDAGTSIITHERYEECRGYWKTLDDFYKKRSGKLWGSVLGKRADVKNILRDITPDITFRDDYKFELGGRHFELYAAPGGESLDGAIVWLPEDRTVITGNLFGPIFGNMPNLYTIRGDKIRSAMRFIESLDVVAALKPEVIVTGHEIFKGEEQIRQALEKMRAAVLYVHQYTIDGMNAGKDVHTLMANIELPDDIKIGQVHGKLSWCVRAIWEEYAGWFHYDATAALYAVPPSAVDADLVELAGGGDALAARAESHIAQKRPLHALHLAGIALNAEPANQRALQATVDAHQQLLEQSKGENFSEVMWLKSEMAAAQEKLDEK